MSTAIIRLSSLGDIVLTGAVTKQLTDVVFVTQPRWREVAERLVGVTQVIHPDEPCPPQVDRVVDLHSSLKSMALALRYRRPTQRVARYDVRRRSRVWFKLGEPPPSVVDRYAAAAETSPARPPWIDVTGPRDALLLCVGGRWQTKRWTAQGFIQVAQSWEGPIRILGGPEDHALATEIQHALGPRCRAHTDAGFASVLAALGHGARAVGTDSGLTHMCLAAGIPTVGIFGPTTSADGFWHWDSPAVELDLPCRPCSRFGGVRCPHGDHACLRSLPPTAVVDALGSAR